MYNLQDLLKRYMNDMPENNDQTKNSNINSDIKKAQRLLNFFNNSEQLTTNDTQEQHKTKKTKNNILDLNIDLLLGGTKVKERKQILERLKLGVTNIIIGTHSLFQSSLEYNNLGLVIIDEQHRFGVAQRSDLLALAKESMKNNPSNCNILEEDNSDKTEEICNTPHTLYMTATPIPRTLTMTLYGDLDVSTIKTKPANRLPIKTRVCFDSQREQIYDFVKRELNKGRQVYIVYPLVEKSEKMELKSAVEHYEIIANEVFPEYKCGLIHGQLSFIEKENVMQQFKNNEYQILVATTVVEVGIDVPNATIMLVEDAERFGLAQLHQLRGRVGRDDKQSYCLLVTKDDFKFKFSRNTKNIEDEKINSVIRLKAMEETNDGFVLAETDIKLRGPGDLLGTKQSGLPNFKYIDLVNDVDIIKIAAEITKQIIDEDTFLEQEKNAILKQNCNKYSDNSQNFINIA